MPCQDELYLPNKKELQKKLKEWAEEGTDLQIVFIEFNFWGEFYRYGVNVKEVQVWDFLMS